MKIELIPDGSTVFLDANIFLYHFEDISPDCSSLLRQVEDKKIRGSTSTHILNEVLHRRLVAEAVALYGWQSKQIVKKLKQNPEKVKSIHKHWEDVENILKIGITIVDLALQDLFTARRIQEKFGLLISDSLVVWLMEKQDIRILATKDKDFMRVDYIDVWVPKVKGT